MCYFLHLAENCLLVQRWFEEPTITQPERENWALDSARVHFIPTCRWWAIKAIFIWSMFGAPGLDWILVSIPNNYFLGWIVHAEYLDEHSSCLFASPPACQASSPPPSVSHTCHRGVAMICASQSSGHLLPGGPDWLHWEISRFFAPLWKQTHSSENDPEFGCVVILSKAITIWVHMVTLVWCAIC